MYMYHPTDARQRLGKNVKAITDTLATTEELLDASPPVRPELYRGLTEETLDGRSTRDLKC